MSLFKKTPESSNAAQTPATAPIINKIPDSITVNLTDKMIHVEMVGEESYIKYGRVEKNGDNIRLISGSEILIAEIGKRSKAYTELEEKVGKRMQWIVLKAKQGDYGLYYQAKIRFEDTTEVYI